MEEGIKTFWYCLKTYVTKDRIRYIPQEYSDKHRDDWYDPELICSSKEECYSRCNKLNKPTV